MRKRITKRSVDSLEPGPRAVFLWDTEISGFGCKVTPMGRKVYIFQYRVRGQSNKTAPKRVTLGKHGELAPDTARKRAALLKLDVRAGTDPAVVWRACDGATVSDLAERFLEKYLPTKKRPPRESTVAYYETLFRCHVVPVFGRKRVDAVTSTDGPSPLRHEVYSLHRQPDPFAAAARLRPGATLGLAQAAHPSGPPRRPLSRGASR